MTRRKTQLFHLRQRPLSSRQRLCMPYTADTLDNFLRQMLADGRVENAAQKTLDITHSFASFLFVFVRSASNTEQAVDITVELVFRERLANPGCEDGPGRAELPAQQLSTEWLMFLYADPFDLLAIA